MAPNKFFEVDRNHVELEAFDGQGERYMFKILKRHMVEVAKSEWRVLKRNGTPRAVTRGQWPEGGQSLPFVVSRIAKLDYSHLQDGGPFDVTPGNLGRRPPINGHNDWTRRKVIWGDKTYPSAQSFMRERNMNNVNLARILERGTYHGKPIFAEQPKRKMAGGYTETAIHDDDIGDFEKKLEWEAGIRRELLSQPEIKRRILKLHSWQEKEFKKPGGGMIDAVTYALRIYKEALGSGADKFMESSLWRPMAQPVPGPDDLGEEYLSEEEI